MMRFAIVALVILGGVLSAQGQVGQIVNPAQLSSGAYAGYSLSYQDYFTTQNLFGPGHSSATYFPTRTYEPTGGGQFPQRGSTSGATPWYLADPLFTGYLDSNLGIAVGSNTITFGAGGLQLQTRAAISTEISNSPDPAAITMVTSILDTAGSIQIYPGSSGNIIVEAEVKWSTTQALGITGWGPTFWMQSATPLSQGAGSPDELDIFETNQGDKSVDQGINRWASNGLTNTNVYYTAIQAAATPGVPYDGNWHKVTCIITTNSTILTYIDNVLKLSESVVLNSVSSPLRIMFMNELNTAGSGFSLTPWTALGTCDSCGLFFNIRAFRVYRSNSLPHYSPQTTVSNVNVDYNGTATITLPSKATLWGDSSVTEYVQAVPFEVNGPGNTATTVFNQFPASVSYNSGTRAISVDFSADTTTAGYLPIMVQAWKTTGSTNQPLVFVINRGPHLTIPTAITIPINMAYSRNIYTDCDVGIITPKSFMVTGLPAGVTFNGSATAPTISGTPTVAGDSTATVTCTNQNGQVATSSVVFHVGVANGVAFGPTTWAAKTGALTSVSASKSILISAWLLNPNAASGTRAIFDVATSGGTNYLAMSINPSGLIQVSGRNLAGTVILNVIGSASFASMGTTWKNVLVSINLATSQVQFYTNDVADTPTLTTVTNDTLAYNLGTTPTLGSQAAGTNPYGTGIADLQVWFGQAPDLSVTANRRLFINSSGYAVTPATAAGTLGTQNILQTGTAASWQTNAGGGGGFTIQTGSISNGSTSPP